MKNTYYFPHDYHARHDPKIEKLMFKLGYEGIGIYWVLVELLYEQGGKIVFEDLPIYTKGDDSLCNRIKSVVTDFNLFSKDSTGFWSDSVLRRLSKIEEKSLKASESASKRWHKESEEPKPKSLPKLKETGEEFINKLKVNPAYKHINFDIEFGKMDAWLSINKRQKTKRFILNWFNRIEKPMETYKPKSIKQIIIERKEPEKPNPLEQAKVAELIHNTAKNMRGVKNEQ